MFHSFFLSRKPEDPEKTTDLLILLDFGAVMVVIAW
jgi:hypothetical protein